MHEILSRIFARPEEIDKHIHMQVNHAPVDSEAVNPHARRLEAQLSCSQLQPPAETRPTTMI